MSTKGRFLGGKELVTQSEHLLAGLLSSKTRIPRTETKVRAKKLEEANQRKGSQGKPTVQDVNTNKVIMACRFPYLGRDSDEGEMVDTVCVCPISLSSNSSTKRAWRTGRISRWKTGQRRWLVAYIECLKQLKRYSFLAHQWFIFGLPSKTLFLFTTSFFKNSKPVNHPTIVFSIAHLMNKK